MKIFEKIAETKSYANDLRSKGLSIGFVPTMGALHEGHLELVRWAKAGNDICICSIFVNPIQFNNPEDLKNYPRTLEEDSRKLELAGCDILFYPSEAEMYPVPETVVYDFGLLDKVMEGAHRPGHFNGVAIVVRKLFEIALPHKAYFGEKDFQQLQIVKSLVKMLSLEVEIIPCPIVREPDGLAMSSRNVRLSQPQRLAAPAIYQSLISISGYRNKMTLQEAKIKVEETISATYCLSLEYIEISDAGSLQPYEYWPEPGTRLVACIAVFAGQVRLIDNYQFVS